MLRRKLMNWATRYDSVKNPEPWGYPSLLIGFPSTIQDDKATPKKKLIDSELNMRKRSSDRYPPFNHISIQSKEIN